MSEILFPSELPKIKIWPLAVISGFRNGFGGAARIWFLARFLDKEGKGWIEKSELYKLLNAVNINNRTFTRWISNALKVGLLHIFEKRLYYVGLTKGCILIGCKNIKTRPVEIDLRSFVRKGWKSIVWGAFLATLKNRPVSQEKKNTITGVKVRSQVRYESMFQSSKIINRCDLGKGDEIIAQGLRENLGIPVFSQKGHLMRVLPNTYNIPLEIARPLKWGQSRKVQKKLNSCLTMRGKRHPLRLFFTSQKKAENNMRRLYREDIHLDEIPQYFIHRHTKPIGGQRIINYWKILEGENSERQNWRILNTIA